MVTHNLIQPAWTVTPSQSCAARQAQAGGENVELSRKEYDLLRVLLERANIPVTRDFLLEALWKASSDSAVIK